MINHKIRTLRVALTLGAFGLLAPAAQPQGNPTEPPPPAAKGMEPMPHNHGDHLMMSREPHHVLAMAYHQNLLVFSKALLDETAHASSVDVEFARAAEKEIRRSFAEMKLHHTAHLLTMDQSMHKEMREMRRKMEKHHTELITMLDALEKEVNLVKPDPKAVNAMAAHFYAHCYAMTKMEVADQAPPPPPTVR